MKVLLSAYACEPGKGSEPEVGLRTLLIAARHHQVWVITRENNVPPLEGYLRDHALSDRIHITGLDVPGVLLNWKKRIRLADQLYYDQWQRAAGTLAGEMHRRIGFDLIHHVTVASYWKRAGVAGVGAPLVWGPVGGGVTAPMSLWAEMGWRGVLEELGRLALRPLVDRMLGFRDSRRDTRVTLAQNRETARRVARNGHVTVVPNALAVSLAEMDLPPRRTREIVTVGNLIPLKGVSIALRAFASSTTTGTRLAVIGDGPERKRLEQLASSLGVADRVEFLGRLPRPETLTRIAAAGVLLHTSLHEEAGMVVAEALSFGTPVVCLDQGGPPELLKLWPQVASAAIRGSRRGQIVSGLAGALDRILQEPAAPPRFQAPDRSFESVVLEAYERALASAG